MERQHENISDALQMAQIKLRGLQPHDGLPLVAAELPQASDWIRVASTDRMALKEAWFKGKRKLSAVPRKAPHVFKITSCCRHKKRHVRQWLLWHPKFPCMPVEEVPIVAATLTLDMDPEDESSATVGLMKLSGAVWTHVRTNLRERLYEVREKLLDSITPELSKFQKQNVRFVLNQKALELKGNRTLKALMKGKQL